MVTIRDIAEIAGVSPSTVSRALRDSPRLRQETKARIQKIAREHNYMVQTPTGRQGELTIGAVIANPQGDVYKDDFFSGVINGISAFLQAESIPFLLETTTGSIGNSSFGLPDMIKNSWVDGVIMGGIPVEQPYIDALLETGKPVVFIGRYAQDMRQLTAVIPDNVSGGIQAGEHLVECGYTHFAFLGGNLAIPTFQDRLMGFRQALSRSGYDLAREAVVVDGMDQMAGYLGMQQLLPLMEKNEHWGIFAATDWLAAGAIRALDEHKISIPSQAGVIGYSDLELASQSFPTITSIRVGRHLLGKLAARTLLEAVTAPYPNTIQTYIQPRLIVRESTGTIGSKMVKEAK